MDRKQIWDILENQVLPLVKKPGRYIGGEINSVIKDLSNVDVRFALAFPDVYEIGMSNLGLKILYEEINNNNGFYAERVFSPWIDLEGHMRRLGIPMFSQETHSPLKEFDIIGFSLQYELLYTNVLNILDLAGIPKRSEERQNGDYPLIIAGGQMAYTPEPIAPYIDLFLVGDGEEVVVKVIEFYKEYGKILSRKEFLERIAKTMDFVYVPGLYKVSEDNKHRLTGFQPVGKEIPNVINRHILKDLNSSKLPEKPIVPLIKIVHDRASVEIMRGCPRNCRFCQAGKLYKPVRKRKVNDILNYVDTCIHNTGYEELGLLSLSSTDYREIGDLTKLLLEKWQKRTLSISLPSMRVDSFNLDLINEISSVKKTGITLAPEAASTKLLDVINKNYGPLDVIDIAQKAYKSGYRVIKLYFMIGLPEEEMADIDELIQLLYKVSKIGFKQVNVSISAMIPKPHTPFQWKSMINISEIKDKQQYIKSKVNKRNIKLKFSNPYLSILEAAFCRGDRRLSDVIYKVWENGARFDQWEECFSFKVWDEAFKSCNISFDTYLTNWEYSDLLPWEHIDGGICKKALIKDNEKADFNKV